MHLRTIPKPRRTNANANTVLRLLVVQILVAGENVALEFLLV